MPPLTHKSGDLRGYVVPVLRAADFAVPASGAFAGEQPTPAAGSELPQSENRNAIAVLPFDNLSDDPENERSSDGITEDILTHLTRI